MLYGTIQRWGNSQGIRIPKGALAASHIGENDAVEIIAEKTPSPCARSTVQSRLTSFFAGYHGDYQPVEFDTGADVGLEVID